MSSGAVETGRKKCRVSSSEKKYLIEENER
jgi:hypothetical protein